MRTDHTAQPRMGRLASAAVLATSLEWFDFLIYSTAAALVFGELFFPIQRSGRHALRSPPSPPDSSHAARRGHRWASATGSAANHPGRSHGRHGSSHFRDRRPAHAQISAWAPALLVIIRLLGARCRRPVGRRRLTSSSTRHCTSAASTEA